ncbi:MAG TPA: SDR family oxidoreductase [Candidatus Udaeobacter sp.]|nr:SDR family oxidoreductase [Candidatus Udaeobacter sp.]
MATVLVTGANRGLGLEFARQYAADGWTVIACCREPAKAKELNKLTGAIAVEALDVGEDAQIAALAKRLKGRSIDLLINNAGVYGPRSGTETGAWLDVFRVNSIAPHHLAHALADNVARSELKRIVSVSSAMGSIGENGSAGDYIYRSSKAALNMAMKGLANELKDRGVIVAILSPGWVKTDMGGRGAPLEAADSIASLRKVIARLKLKDSGKFFSHDGKPIPW